MSGHGHSAAYDVLVGFHVASALVGFASIALSGVYGGNASRAGRSEADRPQAGQARGPAAGQVGHQGTDRVAGQVGSQATDRAAGRAGGGAAGEAALEELRRYFRAPGRLEWAVLAVPFFGVAAVLVGPGSGELTEVWVGLGFGLWVLAAALHLGIVRPAEARLRRTLLDGTGSSRAGAGGIDQPAPAPSPPVLARSGRRLAWASAACDVIFVVALVVMVIKPGT